MEEFNKKRERQIKIFIYLFSLFLLVTIVGVLMWTGVIQFDWSNKIAKSYEYEGNKSKDKKVLVIGDSQLEEWPQINCLYKSIEKYCDENSMGHISVAHHGFGPIEYLNEFQIVADDYKPNLVILFYYCGNDLTDVMLRDDDTPKTNTHPVYTTQKQKKEAPKNFEDVPEGYDVEAALARFDWEAFKNKGIDSMMIEYAKNRLRNPNKIGPEYVNPYVLNMAAWNDNYLIDNNMMLSEHPKGAWYKSLKKFEQILRKTDEIGAELCIVAIPSTVQVDTSHFDFYRKNTFKIPIELTESNAPQKLLKEFSKASNITYINLLPHFKKYPNTFDLYFENDDHLSEKGHDYAYTFVEKEILNPFKNNVEKINNTREKDFYKKYTNWAVKSLALKIKADSNWYNNIKTKALEQNISIDSAIMQDASYVVKKEEDIN